MRTALLIAALLLLVFGCRPEDAGEPSPRELEVHQTASGQTFRGREEPLAVVAPSREELEEALGNTVPKEVTEPGGSPGEREATHLAVFWGEKPSGGYSLSVASARLEGERLVVRLRLRRPGPGEIVTQALTYPYAVAVISGVGPEGREVVLTDQEGRRLGWPVRRA
ncbi:protease complex subunit PrcB family protein [Rubrobacter xylanophilus]|nr:protease complex subunit PrcB family protein [Rubrobacter xylanophilus]